VHGGKHDLFEKIEQELEGCVENDVVQVKLTPEEGFGPYDPALTYIDDLENVPAEFRRIGAEVEMMNDQGESRKFKVTRIEDGKLTVDGNHPMAGKNIIFNIKVVGIRDATPDELSNGVEPMTMPVLH
jgi:FKBP-type peptidyl-prolyl cis-trans isomerase SlyD